LARDAQAKLALIVAQIYLSVHPSVCVCPSVCPRQRMYAALRVASHLDCRLVTLVFKYFFKHWLECLNST